MTARTASILMLALLLPYALFGGARGGMAICLGGGHEHAPSERVSECQQACEHPSSWLTPAPDAHDDPCGCEDVELTTVELRATPREATVEAPAPGAVVCDARDSLEAGPSWRGPPKLPQDDPRGAQRLAIVRSTRLIL